VSYLRIEEMYILAEVGRRKGAPHCTEVLRWSHWSELEGRFGRCLKRGRVGGTPTSFRKAKSHSFLNWLDWGFHSRLRRWSSGWGWWLENVRDQDDGGYLDFSFLFSEWRIDSQFLQTDKPMLIISIILRIMRTPIWIHLTLT
jgi:hypothetical protein